VCCGQTETNMVELFEACGVSQSHIGRERNESKKRQLNLYSERLSD